MVVFDINQTRCLLLHLDHYEDERIGKICRERRAHLDTLVRRFPRIKFELFPASGPGDVADFLAENPEIVVENQDISLPKLAHVVSSIRMFREISFTAVHPVLIFEDDALVPDDFFDKLAEAACGIPDNFDLVKFHVHDKFIRAREAEASELEAAELNNSCFVPLYCRWYETACLVSPQGALRLQRVFKRIAHYTDYTIYYASVAGELIALNPLRSMVETLGDQDRQTSGALGSLLYIQEDYC